MLHYRSLTIWLESDFFNRVPIHGRGRHLPKSGRSIRHRIGVGAAVALCGGLIVTSTVASAATPAKKKLTPLEQGMAFYKGKVITYIAPTTAGSSSDISARAEAKEMSSYLGATVNVEDISIGGSVPGQDDIAAAAPNGLTIGFVVLQSDYEDLISNIPNVNFNPKELAYLGGVPKAGGFEVTQSTSPYKTFADLRNIPISAPVKLVLAPQPDLGLLLYRAFGIHIDPLVGYTSSSLQLTGFLRGDGSLTEISVSAIGPELVAGTSRALLYDTKDNVVPPDTGDYSIVKSVPTAAALFKKYPPKTALEKQAYEGWNDLNSVPYSVTAAPSSTPTDLVDALAAAYKFAVHSTYFKTVQVFQGSLYGFIKPSILKSEYVHSLKVEPRLKSIIASLGGV